MNYYSNEIVFRGHPDKVCDQISGAILNACLEQDKYTRAGIEVMGGKEFILITGEVTTNAKVDAEKIAKRVLKECGYKTRQMIIDDLGHQSNDIARGVNKGGAGDQGMMFGYACNDTPEMLPTAQVILQKFAKKYDDLRIKKVYPELLSDGKAQITGCYNDDFKLIKIKDFTISYQNKETNRVVTDAKVKELAQEICDQYNIKVENWHINPTGKFKIGGFIGDAGLTGRKIVVDAYQSFANVGGGCMNGKDPTKVDFSASHMARKLACEYLRKYKLKWCQVQLSYAIGMDKPLAIYIESNIGVIIPRFEDYERCTPNNIIEELKLREADYEELAKFGHFIKAV